MIPDACTQCGNQIDRTAHPRSAYCSDRCRYAARDSTPQARARQRQQKQERYHDDDAYREQIRTRTRNRYRRRHGIDLAKPTPRMSAHTATIETSTDAPALQVPLERPSTGPTERPTGTQPLDAQKGRTRDDD